MALIKAKSELMKECVEVKRRRLNRPRDTGVHLEHANVRIPKIDTSNRTNPKG